MARLPSSVAFLRPFLHQLRNLARKFLGLDATGAYALPGHFSVELPVGETFQRVMDRICLLESQVNWRLYGMPAAVGNVKLEQAAILANGMELELLVRQLAETNSSQVELPSFLKWIEEFASKSAQSKILVVGSYSLFKSEAFCEAVQKLRDRIWLVLDVEDLYLPAYEALAPKNCETIRAPLLTVLAGMKSDELAGVWLSDSCVRIHPLKWLLVLQQISRGLASGGNAKGLLPAMEALEKDIRHLRTLPVNQWQSLSRVSEFSFASDSFEIKK